MPSSSFNTIGLVVRQDNEAHRVTIQAIVEVLQSYANLLVHYLDEEYNTSHSGTKTLAEIGKQADLVISLGGDGTLLTTAKALFKFNKPLLGINLGRLGFLADVSIQDYEQYLAEILSGEYSVEKRFFIEGEIYLENETSQKHIAFNDIILHSFNAVRMIEYQLSSNDMLIHQQRADGVIVSTPTGSTAYALSGGGPIMHPSLDALCVVPICPHTLSNRPIVLPASQIIEITLVSEYAQAQISFDGRTQALISEKDTIRIKRLKQSVSLLHPKDYDYFHILRAKLHWSTHP